jgi:hypothetical protein
MQKIRSAKVFIAASVAETCGGYSLIFGVRVNRGDLLILPLRADINRGHRFDTRGNQSTFMQHRSIT